MNDTQRMKNALIFGALYDAVGYKFEFDRNPSHKDVDDYIADVIEGKHPKFNFSDDTQMTMFIMEQLYSNTDFSDRAVFDKLVHAYHAWYETQTTDAPREDAKGLLAEPAMYHRRAPGFTCLESIDYMIKESKISVNNSMGCGSVMRILPFAGLIQHVGFDKASDLAVMSGYMTHAHEKNEEAIRLYMSYANFAMHGKIDARFKKFYEKVKHVQKITQLGEGWIAPECVEMGCWVVIMYSGVDALVVSTAHPGDSDSTGMIAGTLLGLHVDKEVNVSSLSELLVPEEVEVIGKLLNTL